MADTTSTTPVAPATPAVPEKTNEQIIKEFEVKSKQHDDDVIKATKFLHESTETALQSLREYTNAKELYLVAIIQDLQKKLQSATMTDTPATAAPVEPNTLVRANNID